MKFVLTVAPLFLLTLSDSEPPYGYIIKYGNFFLININRRETLKVEVPFLVNFLKNLSNIITASFFANLREFFEFRWIGRDIFIQMQKTIFAIVNRDENIYVLFLLKIIVQFTLFSEVFSTPFDSNKVLKMSTSSITAAKNIGVSSFFNLIMVIYFVFLVNVAFRILKDFLY